MRLLLSLTCTLLLACLGGCSTFSGNFADPDIQLLKVEVERARLTEQLFNLTFRIDNPNGVSIPVRGMTYSVQLDGMKLAVGETNDWFRVPAHGRHVFTVPVRTNLWRHLKDVVRMLEKPNRPINYQLQAEIKTGLFFGRKVQVVRNGEIIPASFIPE